jgi:hypothetical protein
MRLSGFSFNRHACGARQQSYSAAFRAKPCPGAIQKMDTSKGRSGADCFACRIMTAVGWIKPDAPRREDRKEKPLLAWGRGRSPDNCCPLWRTASPGRTAHPPASRFSGPNVRYLLDFSVTGSGGHPCPYGASFGILPHVTCKSNVNPGGPRGA